jgi:hypothetical protein
MAADDDSYGKRADGSSVVRVVAVAGGGKHQAWPPMDHFEKLHEETCPNHAYPVKHKLRDCGIMKNFMASRSLTRGMEADEGTMTPYPGEDVMMTIYDLRPSPRARHVSDLCLGAPVSCGWGCGDTRI